MKKRLTVSASPGLLEFRSLKMPNSKRWVFFRWYELPNINQQEFLSREPQWCRFLQLWPLQHPSQSPFDHTDDKHRWQRQWQRRWQRWWGQRQPQRHSFPVDTFQSVSSESIMASTPRTLFQKECISWRSRWEYNLLKSPLWEIWN